MEGDRKVIVLGLSFNEKGGLEDRIITFVLPNWENNRFLG